MTLTELLKDLPPELTQDLAPEIQKSLTESGKTIVVLDDDPTGTQTVFDVPVLTRLDTATIEAALNEKPPVLFLLTNSRAFTKEQTTLFHQELAETLRVFLDKIIIVSRSDSTLRGHFPLETDILGKALDISDAPVLFIPFFAAGGRLTVGDRHYVVEGKEATPAHLTPFAEDNAFPFHHSYLPDYIEEKTEGRIPYSDVSSISIEDLRSGDVSDQLAAIPDGATCIVNATSLKDLDVLSIALHESDRRFIIRSAASFVQSFGGIPSRALLTPMELLDLEENPNGGLFVVGSHVPKTSAQLAHLLKNTPEAVPIELDVPVLLADEGNTLSSLMDQLNETITSGKTAILYTSRDRIDATDETSNLAISKTISGALVSLVKSITARPSFLVAKGGITSSDIATEALGIERAMVLGQILPGVPVWTLGNETRHPGLAYVIFPGNVGDESALTTAYQKLSQ